MMMIQAEIRDLVLTGITVQLEPEPEHVRVIMKDKNGVRANRNASWSEAALAATIAELAAILRRPR